MPMNQHSCRILNNLIALLQDYEAEKSSLRRLVDGLEGGLQAIEEPLPQDFYDEWYKYWGGLEIVLATGTESESTEKIRGKIQALHILLSRYASE
jgi:hypothetical protein